MNKTNLTGCFLGVFVAVFLQIVSIDCQRIVPKSSREAIQYEGVHNFQHVCVMYTDIKEYCKA